MTIELRLPDRVQVIEHPELPPGRICVVVGTCRLCANPFTKYKEDHEFCSNKGPGNCKDKWHNGQTRPLPFDRAADATA